MKLVLAPLPQKIEYTAEEFILCPEHSISVEDADFLKSSVIAKNYFLSGMNVFIGEAKRPVDITVRKNTSISKEGYELLVNSKGIYIYAATSAGVFYAFVTLRQIIMQTGNKIPGLSIKDEPDFKIRGYMFDISRKKVPTLQTLKEKIDLLCFLKINHFELYIEGTPYASANHPDMWCGKDVFTGEDFIELDNYCKERFIEFVPNQNTFGHMGEWIFNGYRHLAEFPESSCPTCLDPQNPESIALVTKLSDDLLQYFTSNKYNIGCDETWDLGKGKSKEICKEQGIGKVYFDYLMKLYYYCKKKGKTMLFWADMINKYPEFIKELPKDVLAMNWGYYNDLPTDKSCIDFKENNIPYCVCPGTAAWNTIIGNVTQMLENTRTTVLKGYRHGAVGVINTEWGDNGHLQGSTTAYPGLLYCAAMSWQPKENEDIDIANALDVLVFEDKNRVLGKLCMEAGKYSDLELQRPENTSFSFNLYKGDISEHDRYKEITHKELETITEYLSPMRNTPLMCDLRCLDAEMIVKEYILNIDMLLTAQKIGHYHLYVLDGNIEREREIAREIYYELLAQRKTLRDTWLMKNMYSELDKAIKPIDKNIQALLKYINV